MISYKSKSKKLRGNYRELYQICRDEIYRRIKQQTKRSPYIRSKYFKSKVFLDFFWTHLMEKRYADRQRRLRFYEAALDLIRNTTIKPESKGNPNNSKEKLHRFHGETAEGAKFVVQIRENINTGRKDFASIVPRK